MLLQALYVVVVCVPFTTVSPVTTPPTQIRPLSAGTYDSIKTTVSILRMIELIIELYK